MAHTKHGRYYRVPKTVCAELGELLPPMHEKKHISHLALFVHNRAAPLFSSKRQARLLMSLEIALTEPTPKSALTLTPRHAY